MPINRNIFVVFILMVISVAGITALQFYYSYTYYKVESATFQKEIDEAFTEAVDSAFSRNQARVVQLFKTWIGDTSYVSITTRWDTLNKQTIFNLNEVQPVSGNSRVSLSLDTYKERTDSLTPEARNVIIDHMTNHVAADLKKGVVWYFTQGLGDRLSDAYYNTPIPRNIFIDEYKKALRRRSITTPFKVIEAKEAAPDGYCTVVIDVGVKTNAGPKLRACFTNADAFLLGRLRWVIGGSVLLLLITLGCFWYTARVLLSQQKLSALKDDFISNMTHEIHTPLTSITITAQVLKQFSHDRTAQDNYLDIILYQSDKLSALADEILAGARLEKEGMALTDVTNINSLLAETAKSKFAENVNVTVVPLPDDIKITGNRANLQRALDNLIDNAVKYSTNVNPAIVIEGHMQNKEFIISIADNGPGIPDELKEKVFEPFYRIPSGNVHNVKGYGLGLSYVQKVIAAHRGSISIEDNTPAGSRFIITLPI